MNSRRFGAPVIYLFAGLLAHVQTSLAKLSVLLGGLCGT